MNNQQNNQSVILPSNLINLASYESIMLNGGMGLALCSHQQAILKAYVEICKENGNKFIPISFKKIDEHLHSLSKVANLIPNNLTDDLPVLHRRGWIKTTDFEKFALTQDGKEKLKKVTIPV